MTRETIEAESKPRSNPGDVHHGGSEQAQRGRPAGGAQSRELGRHRRRGDGALTIYIVLSMVGVALGIEMAVRGSECRGRGRRGDLLDRRPAAGDVLRRLGDQPAGGRREQAGGGPLRPDPLGRAVPRDGLAAGRPACAPGSAPCSAPPRGRTRRRRAGSTIDRVARDLKQAGVDEATVNKYRGYYDRIRTNPADAADVGRELGGDAGAQQAARQASWWSLGGILVSLATVILGSLVGSGELLQPVPILGVRPPAIGADEPVQGRYPAIGMSHGRGGEPPVR